MSTLLSFFVFIAFAVFSVPGGLLAARIGKKNLLLLGLGLNCRRRAHPVSDSAAYSSSCWAASFCLGIGTTFLQVSGNPIMRDVSNEGAYSRNLSFAQGFKGIGSTASTYLADCRRGRSPFSRPWTGAALFPSFSLLMALAFVCGGHAEGRGNQGRRTAQHRFEPRLAEQPIFLSPCWAFSFTSARKPHGPFLQPTLTGLIARVQRSHE